MQKAQQLMKAFTSGKLVLAAYIIDNHLAAEKDIVTKNSRGFVVKTAPLLTMSTILRMPRVPRTMFKGRQLKTMRAIRKDMVAFVTDTIKRDASKCSSEQLYQIIKDFTRDVSLDQYEIGWVLEMMDSDDATNVCASRNKTYRAVAISHCAQRGYIPTPIAIAEKHLDTLAIMHGRKQYTKSRPAHPIISNGDQYEIGISLNGTNWAPIRMTCSESMIKHGSGYDFKDDHLMKVLKQIVKMVRSQCGRHVNVEHDIPISPNFQVHEYGVGSHSDDDEDDGIDCVIISRVTRTIEVSLRLFRTRAWQSGDPYEDDVDMHLETHIMLI